MRQKVLILMMVILGGAALPAGAIACGGGYGAMHDTMDGAMDSGAYERMHGGGGYMGNGYMGDGHMDQFADSGMKRQSAEEIMSRHMEQQNVSSWHLGAQSDGTTYYMNDILGPDGNVINRIMVDKTTGRLHSLEMP